MTTQQREQQFVTTGITTTTAPATVVASGSTGTAQTTPAVSTSVEDTVTIGGYKVHPSALATSTQATSASQNLTAMTAAQHAAALAANDDALHSAAVSPSSPSSGGIVSRVMPVGLTALISYIYYVYTFRVCIDYLLHELRRPTQAYIYLGIFNVLTLLFFISYARTIFRNPGSPMK
ncbi:hypothetical protein BGX28_008001, partial [Mortierella sp. GBA30]